MSSLPRLFDLLPGLYRTKDAQIAQTQPMLSTSEAAELVALQAAPPPLNAVDAQRLADLLAKAARGPLESLLMVIDEQLAAVADDLDQLYDDQFIETCAPWVIPYIGTLIGYQPVNGVGPSVSSPRAEVAHTISFRRRKGTVLALEQLARDVTGWSAHAVEFFQVLSATQYLNHLRPTCHRVPNLRRWEPRAFMNTAFDRTAHTVDVRRIAIGWGRYNIQNIGIFLWSLNFYPVTMSPAVIAAGGNGQFFRISSLGADMPLFNLPESQGVEITASAQPVNVPDRLRRRVLCRDLWPKGKSNPAPINYGVGKGLEIYLDGSLVDPSTICVCDLSGPEGGWANVPPAGGAYALAIDPQLGRIALPKSTKGYPLVEASYHYGFSGDMGGGEYPRDTTFSSISADQTIVRIPKDFPTLQGALNALAGNGVVEITDSNTYLEPKGVQVSVAALGHIELRARDGCRPTIVLGAEITVSGGSQSSLDLNGLLVTYAPFAVGAPVPVALVHVPAANDGLTRLGLSHLTLVPGWALTPNGGAQPGYQGLPTVRVESSGVQLDISKSIVGGLWVSGQSTAQIADSIVDSTNRSGIAYVAAIDPATQKPQPGGALSLDGCTVVGKVHASLLSLVSDSIFWAQLTPADAATTPPLWKAPLWTIRRQEGCVRFSYLPQGAIVSRQYNCVEEAVGAPEPLFTTTAYGAPAYLKLFASTVDAVRRGAEDGGEMGAFHFLLSPLRETDLRVRLQEYLPVGLDFGIFYET